MNSCNNPRQNMTARSEQGAYRNMPQRPMGCEQRMPERERCDGEMSGKKWPIGMSYVPWQEWRNLYPVEEGFYRGTIFKEMDLPFTGRRMC